MNRTARPVPTPTADSTPYWQSCRRHRLTLQRCERCRHFRFIPRVFCPNCYAAENTWVEASGKGEVYTFTVVHRAPSPAFAAEVPYVVAFVQLEEGVRMMTNIVGCRPEEVRIGMKVEVCFEDISEDISLPKFRPVAPIG